MKLNPLAICAVLMLIAIGSGCATQRSACPVVLPIRIFESVPAYRGEVSIDADDAAIRYIAIAESLLGESEYDSHYLYIEEDGIDQFVAYNDLTDQEDSDLYAQRLLEQQCWIQEIEYASVLLRFRGYLPPVIYGQRADDDLNRAIRAVTDTLEADAVRLWSLGATEEAISRADLIIRVARQSLRAPNADATHGLRAASRIETSLDLYEHMLESSRCGALERKLIGESLRQIGTDDPADVVRLFARSSASNYAAMEEWMSIEGGSPELWYTIGQYLVAMTTVRPILEAIESAIAVTFDGKQIEEGDDPYKWPPDGTDAVSITAAALSEFVDIEFEDLQAAFQHATSDSELMFNELCSGAPDQSVMESIDKRAELDETTISVLLNLHGSSSVIETHYRLLEQRDRVSSQCESR